MWEVIKWNTLKQVEDERHPTSDHCSRTHSVDMRLEVYSAVGIHLVILWVFTPCSLVSGSVGVHLQDYAV